MKFVLGLLIAAFSLSANASLKLSTQLNAYDNGAHTRPLVGLGWYQKIWKDNVALNSWAGMGDEPFLTHEDTKWFSAKTQLDINMGKWTLSPGYQFKHVAPYDADRGNAYLRIDYKIFN